MSTSGTELRGALAQSVRVSDDALVADLADGRTIAALAWFPRLAHGTPAERVNWRLIAGGEGIHWPDLDEDISVASLLAGRRSGETQESLRRWLQRRES
jgi:Protein of unknown function (DUF2442)